MKVAENSAKQSAQKKPEIPEVHVGDKVNHNKFGKGTVLSLGENKFSVQFDEGVKTLSTIALENGIVKII